MRRDKIQCESCREQTERYVVTLTNTNGEVLDTVRLCLDCLTSARVLDVLSPGAVDDEPDYSDAGPRTGR